MRQRLTILLLGLAALFIGPATAAKADSVTHLPFTTEPVWLAVDPVGKHVFVSGGAGTSSIAVLDFDGNIVKTITAEGGASQMALDTATHTLYVALHDATAISEINTTTLSETTRFSTAPYPGPTDLVIAGGKLWFTCSNNNGGCVVSAHFDGSGMATPISSWPFATTLAGVGSLLALGVGGGPAAAVYDVSQDPPALVGSREGGDGANVNDMTFDPSGANLLFACGIPDHIEAFDTSTMLSSAQYPTGLYPDSVAVSADGNYVAGGVNTGTGEGDDVFVFPVGETTPVRTWTLGVAASHVAAHSLAFSPDGSRLFAVAYSSTGKLDFYVLDQPTVPAVETSTSLTASEQGIYTGAQVTLTAHVTGTSTGTVHLYGTPDGGSKTLLATGSVGAGGTASFTVSPALTTTYQAVLEAGPGYAASISAENPVTVTPPSPTTVSLSTPQQSVLAGNQATLTAQVSTPSTGTVDLYGTPSGGSKTLVTTVPVGPGGTGMFDVNPTASTTYSAVFEPGRGYTSSTSQDVMVIVVPRSMPIAASRRRVTYGEKVKLTLTGVKSGAIELFATPKGQAQVLLKKASVPAGQHTISFTVPPRRITTYVAERADQSAATKDVTVSVRPHLVFAVAAKRVSPRVVRRRGEKVVLAAGRKPALPGEPLGLEIDLARPHGGWQKFAEGVVPVGRSGIFVAVLSVKKIGRFRARVSYRGDGAYVGVNSRWRLFRVG